MTPPKTLTDTMGAEQMLEALMQRSAAALLIVDDDRRYVEASQAACEMLGVPRDRLLELRIDDFMPQERKGTVEEDFQAFIAAGNVAGDYELERADGTRIKTHFSATANIFPGHHLSVFTVVTEEELDLETTGGNHDGNHDGKPADQLEKLTDRERQILTLLALGESNQTIAGILHLAPETVRNYTRSARLKLGAKSRSHAIAIAVASGQLDLSGDGVDGAR